MRHSILALALAVLAEVVSAQTPAKLALEQMIGHWTGSGRVNGDEVRAALEIETVLESRFTRIVYRFTQQGQTRSAFEGHGYYEACRTPDCRGRWFDSQGATHTLTAIQTEAALTAEWGEVNAPRGRTEYRVTTGGSLTVTDWIRTPSGEWRQFGQVVYTRSR